MYIQSQGKYYMLKYIYEYLTCRVIQFLQNSCKYLKIYYFTNVNGTYIIPNNFYEESKIVIQAPIKNFIPIYLFIPVPLCGVVSTGLEKFL